MLNRKINFSNSIMSKRTNHYALNFLKDGLDFVPDDNITLTGPKRTKKIFNVFSLDQPNSAVK